MVILVVGPQVLGEVVDPCGEQGHLHLGGTGVALVAPISQPAVAGIASLAATL